MTKEDTKTSQQIVFDPSADRQTVANQAIANAPILEALVEGLSSNERRIRQFSAQALAEVGRSAPDYLKNYIPELADGLYRPEAQTRWETLETLTRLIQFADKSQAWDEALTGAEASLHDEDSGTVRLAAFKFLCAFGGTSSENAEKVWPLIDEGIQCYHGDPEFDDMLQSLVALLDHDIPLSIKTALADRMRFDAANGRGLLRKRAIQIISAATGEEVSSILENQSVPGDASDAAAEDDDSDDDEDEE